MPKSKKKLSKNAESNGAVSSAAIAPTADHQPEEDMATPRTNQAAKKADQQFWRDAAIFRDWLKASREKYAGGRNYDAIKKLREALEFGAKHLPRFEEHSLVKAHVLLELGLASGAVCTDFETGPKWEAARKESDGAFAEALNIFLVRLAEGTLTTYRRDEVWIQGHSYESPVAHSERLGPIDYLSCTQMAIGTMEPSVETASKLKKAIKFCKAFKTSKCKLNLEGGPSLQADLPGELVSGIKRMLQEHEHVLAGGDRSVPDPPERDEYELDEVRHTGGIDGEMAQTNARRATDVEERGLKFCEYCREQEKQPRQFKTCSGCKFAAYCCKEHQKAHWKVHKKECATVFKQERAAYKEVRQATRNVLMPGQVQQFFTVVHELHVFCANATEMRAAARRKGLEIPRVATVQEHMELSIPEIGLLWDALFEAMSASEREPMLQRFVAKMRGGGDGERYMSESNGGPPFSLSVEWSAQHVSGCFAVVEHTAEGSILLHECATGKVDAYLVKGLSQPLEHVLSKLQRPLPLFVRTALLPFKDVIVTHGCIAQPLEQLPRLQAAALAHVKGGTKVAAVISCMRAADAVAEAAADSSPPVELL